MNEEQARAIARGIVGDAEKNLGELAHRRGEQAQIVDVVSACVAGAQASLALYWQREADRLEAADRGGSE